MKKIYVILNSKKYDKEDVMFDFKREGFRHEFIFGNLLHISKSAKKNLMVDSDEVWLMGDCSTTEDYKIAKEEGFDVWIMG